jgi:hypothetical protein
MTRLYSNFISQVYNRDGVSYATPGQERVCARQECPEPIVHGAPVWHVCANQSDGWVNRHAEVHPACGEAMHRPTLIERLDMERAAVARRNARRARVAG